MAKIIVFSDMHGNLAALQAAWTDIQERPRDRVYCLGDLAAFGPEPEETLRYVREVIQPDVTLLGNTDRYLLQVLDGAEAGAWTHDEGAAAAIRWGAARLSAESVAWLRTLPGSFQEVLDGTSVELVHAAPGDDERGVGPISTREDLEGLFGQQGPGLTFCGHTHVPFRVQVGERLVVNVGSVGLPFDGDFRACYVRGKVAEGHLHDFENRRVPYSMARTLDAIAREGLPDAARYGRRLRFSER